MRCRPNHFTTFQRLISLVLTIKSCLFSCGLHGFQQKQLNKLAGFIGTIKNSFCLLLLAKTKCTRVLGSFFDRVPSTLTFEYEYQPSTWGSEYEYSKNGTRVVLEYEYCTRILQHCSEPRVLGWYSYSKVNILGQKKLRVHLAFAKSNKQNEF